MGVAGLFRILMTKFKNISMNRLPSNISYLLIDYNGIIYKAVRLVERKMKNKNIKYEKKKFEDELLDEVIEYTKNLVCKTIKPKEQVYIAIDGPAPRAKMVQQRSRRFKKIQEEKIKEKIKKKYDIKTEESWNASANMSPGTSFMLKLTKRLSKEIKKGTFSEKTPDLYFILSSGDVPGEGEHKFMPFIRKLIKKNNEKEKKIVIYSGDADLIPLSISTGKNNIYLCQEFEPKRMTYLKGFDKSPFVYTNIDILKKQLFNNLVKNMDFGKSINLRKFVNDYNFILSFGGNDFIHGLPFTKVKSQGIDDILIPIYRRLYLKFDRYLVTMKIKNKKKEIDVNSIFLKDIFNELAQLEDKFMKNYYESKIKCVLNGSYRIDEEKEKEMTQYEIDINRFDNIPVNAPIHPLYKKYFKEFEKIDYSKKHEEWKKEYYSYYFGIDPSNKEEYNKYINEICINYLEALIFVQKYYLLGLPSWTWKYRYRVSPMPSDVFNILDKGIIDVNDIKFNKGDPYTPYEQLMLILPPQMSKIVPKKLGDLMKKPEKLLVQYYPIDFKVDITSGLKYMYSEAILPEIEDDFFLKIVKEEEKKLNEKQLKRNEIRLKPRKIKMLKK